MGWGLAPLWPASSHILWTGVPTLAPPTILPNRSPPPLLCQESKVGRVLGGGGSGMSLSGANTGVPTSAEASGADGGTPDLVWNGEAGSDEPPPGKGRALRVTSQVGASTRHQSPPSGLPELLACWLISPGVGELFP